MRMLTRRTEVRIVMTREEGEVEWNVNRSHQSVPATAAPLWIPP
jgi:hypothetical protein